MIGATRMTGMTGMTGMNRMIAMSWVEMTRVNSITGVTRMIGMTWMTAHFYLNIIKYTFKEQHTGSKLGFLKGQRHYFLLLFCSI